MNDFITHVPGTNRRRMNRNQSLGANIMRKRREGLKNAVNAQLMHNEVNVCSIQRE